MPSISLSFSYFHYEIKKRVAHFGEPVGHSAGDDDHIAFLELPLRPAGDFVAADFPFAGRFATLGFSAGDDRRGPVDHVEDIGIALMHLDLAGRRHAATRLDLVATIDHHRNTLG